MKIAVLEPLGTAETKLRELLSFPGIDLTLWPDRQEDPETLITRARDADILVFSNIPFKEDILRQLPELKYICCAFTGTDHIELNYCQEHHIKVSNCAGYSTAAVSDLVFGMVIDLCRHLKEHDRQIRISGNRLGYLGPELEGLTFGIIGCGAIGTRTALIARAFGCKVLACSRTVKEIEGVDFCSLEELLEKADIISLHLPLNQQTKGIIGRTEIAMMKPGALLINCARGPLVDYDALAEALRSGKLAGAGIDVFETEPPIPANHPLLSAPNCILTPHIAFSSRQAMEKRALIVRENIAAYLAGQPINVVI